jgi:probable F420-dependent oxidoreductase
MQVHTTIPMAEWRTIADAARAAEAAGFDALTTSEIANDLFTPLAFAALATERVRLGTAIAVAFPRSPMVTAMQSWDLQTNSRGRFVLGLGTQVKAHNERRFSTPWTAPVARMREYVEALRAIWACWENRTPLRYEGEHYRFTLMTPEFSPPPSGLPRVPVTIAAVGPDMLRMAGRVCDGVRLHGFCTRRYLEEVAMPKVEEGLAKAGRPRDTFEVWGGGFVATGPDEGAARRMMEWVRYRLAFYGSTPAYAGVLRLHGWDDLHHKLHRMSRAGEWKQMAAEVPDEVVHEFAVVCTFSELEAAVEKRFGGLSDAVAMQLPDDTPAGQLREIVQEVRRVPSRFRGFPDQKP